MRGNYIFLVPCALWLLGCADRDEPVSDTADVPAASFEETYAAAEQALARAEARRNVWAQTENLLQASQLAYGEGRRDDAIELATEARLQAELAVEQAEHEKQAWRTRVLTE